MYAIGIFVSLEGMNKNGNTAKLLHLLGYVSAETLRKSRSRDDRGSKVLRVVRARDSSENTCYFLNTQNSILLKS